MRYALVVLKDSPIPRSITDEILCLTGLFQWLNIFKGDQLSLSELDAQALEYYDVLHVNITTHQCSLVSEIKKLLPKSSDTKVIANLDYAVELIQPLFSEPKYPLSYAIQSMKDADVVFSVEETQKQLLENMVKREFNLIPHPCNTKMIKSLRRDGFEREDTIAAIYHREEHNSIYPSYTLDHNFEKKYKSVLYGFTAASKDYMHYGYFDEIRERIPANEFLEELSKAKIALEPYHKHSYGRFSIDTACLGVATVGSNIVQSMKRCWPKLCVDPFDIDEMRKKINLLMRSDSLYDEVVDFAYDEVEYYSHEHSKQRMLAALDEVK